MSLSQKKREDLESVNESVETTASMDYISERKKYVVFSKYSTKRTLEDVQEVIEDDPEYLLQPEKEFIETFVDIFSSARTHTRYNVDPEDYLEMMSSAIGAMQSRMSEERSVIIHEDTEGAEDIQYLFFKISDLLQEIHEDMMENYQKYSQNPMEFLDNKHKVKTLSNCLARAYYFEFEYFRGNEIGVSEVRNTIVRINKDRELSPIEG